MRRFLLLPERDSALLLRAFACAGIVTLAACATDEAPQPESVQSEPIAAEFVGGQVCATCHAAEAESWRGSHHDLAMQPASGETILGDFSDVEFVYNEMTSRFFTRDGEYWVNTEGPDGALQDFRVSHTFGVDPLQQYLIELPRGHVQALSIAWDTRDASEGGQRWFHLYPEETIDSEDPLHWTGTYQSWNTMCAECHSTNLQKNYDPAEDAFATSWSVIDVDCEACHGPGSAHANEPVDYSLAASRAERAWVFVGDAVTATLQAGESSDHEIEICAQCHARRSQLTDDYSPGDAFLDAFRPAMLESYLYHADGQILDEVYVYGSFMQSAMYGMGVTCSDCHNPHSVQTHTSGNALCSQCHMSEAFDTSAHHHHEAGSVGAQCVNCHMPERTYMVVDPRRDHSLRVPRPDLTVSIGTPNACSNCHADETAQWAAEQIAQWYPDGRHQEFHFGQALHAGRNWTSNRTALLNRVIADNSQPQIVRATALSLLANPPGDAALDAIETALLSSDQLILLAALDALGSTPAQFAIQAGQRFLTHELRAIRVAAARALAPSRASLSERRQADLDAALLESAAVHRFNSDRGEGQLGLADMLVQDGRLAEAEAAYLRAIEQEHGLSAIYVNLADLYRRTGRESEGQAVLRRGLAAVPEDPGLHLALGLSLVRTGETDEAIELIEQAVALGSENPWYFYVLGIALNSNGEGERATAVLESAFARFPGYRDIAFALATMYRDSGELSQALTYTRHLLEIAPADAAASALLAELEATSQSAP